jgi:DNA modification methylase
VPYLRTANMTPWLQDPDVTLYHGDNLDVLRELPDKSVHMCATSPPFYGLRDYGTDGQIGLEDTPDEWVANLVAVFREVRRVLRDDGTLWVEIGDSYAAGGVSGNTNSRSERGDSGRFRMGGPAQDAYFAAGDRERRGAPPNTKPKDLLGQPWLLAFALRNDGWYLRSEIIWARPNPMPESVTDRPTKSHSTVFLLSKQPRYFYDADAIRETSVSTGYEDKVLTSATPGYSGNPRVVGDKGKPLPGVWQNGGGANARSVWTVPTQPTPFAHFATWPEALCRRMILAGTSERGCCPECGAPWVRDVEPEGAYAEALAKPTWASGGLERGAGANKTVSVTRTTRTTRTTGWSPGCAHDAAPVPCTVLDPFAGSATTMLVARNHGRHSIGIELNETYLEIAAKRLQQLSLLA